MDLDFFGRTDYHHGYALAEGIGAGPESHGRGVNGFVGVAVGGDVAKEAVGSGKVVLGGG